MPLERPELNYVDRQEEIWFAEQGGKLLGASISAEGAGQLPEIDKSRPFVCTKSILHRPSLRPIYGGPTLIEALWNEMDRLMEGLMTGQGAEDGGDRFRAAELAWVIAIVTNAYAPSVDRVRAEAVARWNATQEEV